MADCGKCFKCREGRGCIRSVGFSPSSMPNRHPSAAAGVIKEKHWDADMPAYKRLRNNGIQPPRIDNASILERKANDQLEVEMGTIIPKEVMPKVKEGMAIAKELEIQPSQIQKGAPKRV